MGDATRSASGAIGGTDERAESIGYLSFVSYVCTLDADPPAPDLSDTARLKGNIPYGSKICAVNNLTLFESIGGVRHWSEFV